MAKTKQTTSVVVEIPFADVPVATFGLHIDTRLSTRHSNVLRRIAAGLDRQKGTQVDVSGNVTTAQALRHLLEAAAEAAGI